MVVVGDWTALVRIDGSPIGAALIHSLGRETIAMSALDPMIPVGTYVELWLVRGSAAALASPIPALMEASDPVSMLARLEMVSATYLEALGMDAAAPGERE